MARVTTHIPVEFQGEGEGIEELTWGQLDLWLAMERMGTWMPLGFVEPLLPGTTADDIADELRFLVTRYHSLRTRLQFGHEDGLPRQVVAGEGTIPLEIVDAEDADDPARVAADCQVRLESTPYDFTSDWPVRVAVIRHHGTATHQVVVLCHLVSDAGGGRIMAEAVADRRDRAGARPEPGVAATQPMRIARWQRTPAARRQSLASVRYTLGVLRTMPARRFGTTTDRRQPRYWQFGFTSRAAQLALEAIAARTGLDTAPVLLTAYLIALARMSGQNPAVSRVLVGNRFRPELAEAVAPISQAGLLMVDLAGLTFDEALARTRSRAMSAYKYACYDPRDMADLEDKVSRERGEVVEVGAFFNDRRPPATGGPPTAPPTREQVLAALPATTLRHEARQDEALEQLFLHVNHAPGALDLTVLTDTHYISPTDVEALLHIMEAVAVEGAFQPSAPTRVPVAAVATAGTAGR